MTISCIQTHRGAFWWIFVSREALSTYDSHMTALLTLRSLQTIPTMQTVFISLFTSLTIKVHFAYFITWEPTGHKDGQISSHCKGIYSNIIRKKLYFIELCKQDKTPTECGCVQNTAGCRVMIVMHAWLDDFFQIFPVITF